MNSTKLRLMQFQLFSALHAVLGRTWPEHRLCEQIHAETDGQTSADNITIDVQTANN